MAKELPHTGYFAPSTYEMFSEVEYAHQLKTNEQGKLKHPVKTIKMRESRRASLAKRKKN